MTFSKSLRTQLFVTIALVLGMNSIAKAEVCYINENFQRVHGDIIETSASFRDLGPAALIHIDSIEGTTVFTHGVWVSFADINDCNEESPRFLTYFVFKAANGYDASFDYANLYSHWWTTTIPVGSHYTIRFETFRQNRETEIRLHPETNLYRHNQVDRVEGHVENGHWVNTYYRNRPNTVEHVRAHINGNGTRVRSYNRERPENTRDERY